MRTHLARPVLSLLSPVLSALLLAALMLGGVSVAAPTPAAAADGCVAQSEFAKVKKGFSKAKVARVFGTKGKREAISRGYGVTIEIRSYRACTRFGAVSVSFENGRLSAKSAVF